MNAAPDTADPFGELMTFRVRPVPLVFEQIDATGAKTERRFNFELREAAFGQIQPLLANAEENPAEFGLRLLGLAVYLDGHQLTFERVEKMPPAVVGKLLELVPAIVEMFRLDVAGQANGVPADPDQRAAAASSPPDDPPPGGDGAEARPPGRQKQKKG